MVNIFRGDIVLWETDEFDYNKMLNVINNNPNYYNMCFLMHHNNKILGAISAMEILGKADIKLISYELSWDLFERARDFYYNNEKHRYILIPITNLDGEYIFTLQYMKNKGTFENTTVNYKDYWTYNIEESAYLDYSIIKNANKYVFYELDEYSFAITNLIKEIYPEKEIIYLDDRISYFYDDIKIYDSVFCIKDKLNRSETLYIREGGYCGEFPNKTYGSIQLFSSIIWCCKIKNYGELNANKIIFVINYPTMESGIVEIAKYTFAYYLIAKERGWVPIINLNTFPNQYLKNENENVWNYYFEDLSEITMEEAYKSKNVIYADENEISLWYFENIYCREKFNMVNEICLKGGVNNKSIYGLIKLNKETLEKADLKMPCEIKNKNKRILGVVARGTDLKKENRKKAGILTKNADIEKILKRSEFLKEIYDCEYIFVATEDEIYLEQFKSKFNDKLLFINQKRFNIDNDDDYKRLAQYMNEKTDSKSLGYDYLTAVACLAKCDLLISSANCGAYWLSKYFNENNFEYSEIIENI